MNGTPPETPNGVTDDKSPPVADPASQAQPPVRPATADDQIAYRLAIGSIGLALVAYLIGAALIAAGGKPIPTQYWTAGTGLAGALLGILAPTPTPALTRVTRAKEDPWFKKLGTGIANVFRDLWSNREVLILMVVFGFSLGFAIANNSSQLEAVAAAAGGALVGLLAPPPSAGE
jgi:hypothetical protein